LWPLSVLLPGDTLLLLLPWLLLPLLLLLLLPFLLAPFPFGLSASTCSDSQNKQQRQAVNRSILHQLPTAAATHSSMQHGVCC
jgi:hypothetical protein